MSLKSVGRNRFAVRILCTSLFVAAFSPCPIAAQQDANARIIQGIDAAVHDREKNLHAYTVKEHYAVFRNHDEQHPAADMVVKTTYRNDVGKNYSIESLNGSLLLRKLLETVLDTEKRMTQPANRATAVITPANYEMTVKGPATVDGRDCLAVAIKPRRAAPYLFNGTIWVDAQNWAIVQLQGTTTRSPSIVTGPSQVFRQYTMVDGFPMATHARAMSNSSLLGETIIKIDYTGYEIQSGAEK